jgi:hypothetical protein
MSSPIKTVAIFGAGKLGIVLAKLALAAGYHVFIAGSGDPQKIRLTIETLVPGAVAASVAEASSNADLVILALPLGKYQSIDTTNLDGKLVIDAMNYWWEVDGERSDLKDPNISTSEIIQAFIPGTRVVKALSHIGYHDLLDEADVQKNKRERSAVAIAGNKENDTKIVAEFVRSLGFDPVIIGDLAKGIMLEPGSNLFGAHVTSSELSGMLKDFPLSEKGKQITAARAK